MLYEEKIIETIPVGPLGLIPLKSCEDLGRQGRQISGGVEKRARERAQDDDRILQVIREIPISSGQTHRDFGSGEAKGEIEDVGPR